MDFFVVGIIYWVLIGASVLLFLAGLIKKSYKAYLWSGIAFLVPAFIFYGGEGWVKWLVLFPLLSFLLAYFTNKKS